MSLVNCRRNSATDDSRYRVELLTPAQFHFATSLGGVDFRPQLHTASIDDATGRIAYAVNEVGPARVAVDGNPSDIKTIIDLLNVIMPEYITVSRALAVRIALQGGLKDFARGLTYDVATDKYVATTNRQLAPMFANDNGIWCQATFHFAIRSAA